MQHQRAVCCCVAQSERLVVTIGFLRQICIVILDFKRVPLLLAFLTLVLSLVMLAETGAAAEFAPAALAVVLAEARPTAVLALIPLTLVLAHAGPAAFFTLAPLPLVLAQACSPALFTCISAAIVLTDAFAAAVTALASLAAVWAQALPTAIFALVLLAKMGTDVGADAFALMRAAAWSLWTTLAPSFAQPPLLHAQTVAV